MFWVTKNNGLPVFFSADKRHAAKAIQGLRYQMPDGHWSINQAAPGITIPDELKHAADQYLVRANVGMERLRCEACRVPFNNLADMIGDTNVTEFPCVVKFRSAFGIG